MARAKHTYQCQVSHITSGFLLKRMLHCPRNSDVQFSLNWWTFLITSFLTFLTKSFACLSYVKGATRALIKARHHCQEQMQIDTGKCNVKILPNQLLPQKPEIRTGMMSMAHSARKQAIPLILLENW